MKKLLSIILALTVIVGIIPSVFADNTTSEIVYDFTTVNDTWSLGVASQSANFKSTSAGLRWTFYLAEDRDVNESGNAVVPTFGAEGTVVRAAAVELKSLKSGTYNVTLDAVKRNSGAVMEFHLVKKTSEIESYVTKENITDFIKTLESKTRLGKIDICTEESAKFNSFAVSEDGDYYLVMIPIGSNRNFEALYSDGASKYYAFNDIVKITFSPVAYPRKFVYNLNSQAFNLSTSAYVSANDSQTAGVLKYNGTNSSSNTTANRNANGAWVGTKNNTATAAVRNVNSLAYTYIKDGENLWGYVADGGRNNIYAITDILYMNFSADKLDAGTYLTLKINVPDIGKYRIDIAPKAFGLNDSKWVGAAADVYIVSPDGYAAESWLNSEKVTSIQYFTDNVATGSFEVASAGDYYVVIDYNKNDAELTKLVNGAEIAYYVAQIKAITLTRIGNTSEENAIAAEKLKQQSVTGNPVASSGEVEPTTESTVHTFAAFIGGGNKSLENAIVKDVDGLYSVTTEEAIDGYTFLYWTKGLSDYSDKRIVSVNTSFVYKPEIGSNYLIAVYGKNDATQPAKYYNANGQLLANDSVPSMPGYGNFVQWVDCGNNIFMAEYEGVEKYNITVNNDGSFKEKLARNYGEEVSVTAPNRASDGYRMFAYWEKDGEIVSFSNTYTFYAFEDCSVNAVYNEYEPLASSLRKIILTNMGNSNYMAEFIGFGDAIEKGIMVGTNKIAMTTNKTQFTIDAQDESSVKGYAVDSAGKVYYSE